MDKFNATQDLIETDTKITVSGGNVSTSVLSDNREVQDWGRKLQSLAFEAVGSATGSTFTNNFAVSGNGVEIHSPGLVTLAGAGAQTVDGRALRAHQADTLYNALRIASVMPAVPTLFMPGCMMSPVR